MKSKLTMFVLLIFLCGCDFDRDYRYIGKWQDTSPGVVLDIGPYMIPLKHADGSVEIVKNCIYDPIYGLSKGQKIIVHYRVVNYYSTADLPCWQVDSWKIIGEAPHEH